MRPATRRRARGLRARALLLALLPPLFAGGCAPTLAAAYDPYVDESATVLQREMDAFLTRMESRAETEEGSYAHHAEFYQDYMVNLRAVEVRAGAQQQNDITLRQIALMKDSVEQLRATHEQQDRIGAASARTFRDLFNTAWRAVIEWELAKKRGER